MLKANAGFVRFKPPVPDADGNPLVVFQVGMQSPTAPTSIAPMTTPFTAFQCSTDPDGTLEYDTVVYISNRSGGEIQVEVRITNAENGAAVVDTFVLIGAFKMLAYSLAGALK